jgi:DNA end-binding protein Ku
MWKGAISFGMVTIPVRLYVATESHSASFRQLCADHLTPIKYKRWCEAGDHEVAYADIRRGFELGKDRFVVLEDSDLQNLPLPTSRTIEITEFVPSGGIEPGLYFKSAYYMEPEDIGRKPYHLLRRALDETGMVAVAKIAFRDREHLCALQPTDGMMLMNTLHWPDEIRSTEGLRGLEDGDVKIDDRELRMAKSLVDSLAEDSFDAARYHDDYQEALMAVVEAKSAGEEVVEAPAEAEEGKVMDLMEALRASVEKAKADRPAARPAARRQARRKAG